MLVHCGAKHLSRILRMYSLLTFLLCACFWHGEAYARARVEGSQLLDDAGRLLNLRGANVLPVAPAGGLESADLLAIRALGGNLARLAFFYEMIAQPGGDTQAKLGGEGLKLLDAACRWAEDAGVWFILDCHVPPGGCNPAPWCAGGARALFTQERNQELFVEMWAELARRYRHHKHLLAYELMNEPVLPKGYSMEQYRQLCLRVIDAIRAQDPEGLIVVGGDNWSSARSLTDELLLPRPGVIYTFHFYEPSAVPYGQGLWLDGVFSTVYGRPFTYPGVLPVAMRWISNSPEDWGATGDTDWHLLEQSFTPPDDANYGMVLLRSTNNAGTAWFDEVELVCDGEPVRFAKTTTFDEGAEDWWVERETAGEFKWDSQVGHRAPGSLRISGTDSYNAFYSRLHFPARPGARYTLRCWVKTAGATGHTYPCVAWFHVKEEHVDGEWIAQQISPAVKFRRRHNVPVFCGEFGCTPATPGGYGLRWIEDVATVLSRENLPWTYWVWREQFPPGSMAVWCKEPEGPYVLNGSLWEVLSGL
ncbi:MAG: glycoside hydrolase family 5 protein, partial [Armatimonadetes bacterium]|nr:glycoside hydrolase family 5 protein [Armatimonadota bacterium]